MKGIICGNCRHWYTVSTAWLAYVEGIYFDWHDHGACDVHQCRLNRRTDASSCFQFDERKPRPKGER